MRRIPLLTLAVVSLVLGAAGCVSGPARLEPSRPVGPARQRRVVGAAELGAMRVPNAYEAVRVARARLGVPSEAFEPRQGIRVYIDGVPVVRAAELRRLPIEWVADVEYLPAEAATSWLGAGHSGGAILVSTWAGRR
jgi:hypothetical protein